jgi:two-component system, chemotaxis family, chemotaxis protein CheY
MRFLIVDDSSTMRRIIINTVNKLGHQDVAEAGNGREGLDRLSAGGPVDVIITDWNMPEMSGIDFIRTVRSMPDIKDTPVLMVTTNAAKDDIVEALKAGVNSYVVKPFTPDAGDALRPGANVVGTVAFAGKTSCLVVFYSTLDAARVITASMLGIEPSRVNGELHDAIGELTNMIAGSFRTRVAHSKGETWARRTSRGWSRSALARMLMKRSLRRAGLVL